MTIVTPGLASVIFAAGAVAGAFGALLGIGGGVFLVPFLTLAVGFPITSAAAISLTTVIATSSSVSAGRTGQHLINLRLGMALEVATAAGSLLGGVTAQILAPSTLERLFGIVSAAVAVIMLSRLQRRNVILDSSVDPGPLGGRYYEEESGTMVVYRVKHLPIGLLASFVAGNVSSLVGIGGGVIKVPALTAWCGVPLRAAAATSAFMIGVTATAGAVIYYGHGQLNVLAAGAAVLGVMAGSSLGIPLSTRTPVRSLKLLMALVLFAVSGLMLVRAAR
jgi:uncharacterized membrane protein YfcA